MDITFAIADDSNTKMILVDFKLNMNNPNNLNHLIKEKVEGSINLLDASTPIYEKYVFVLQPNKVHQARSRIQRIIPRLPENYIAMSLQDLINRYLKKIY